MGSAEEDIDEVMHSERRLLDADVRSDPVAVRSLLHPDFVENGASGRQWGRDDVVEALGSRSRAASEAADMYGVELAPGVVLLTYRVVGAGASLRSSVWVCDDDGWRLRFHQGTTIDGSQR